MSSSADTSSSSSDLKFTIDLKTLELSMDLNTLLSSVGAPRDLIRFATSESEHHQLIYDDAKLYSLPVRLIPAFIDRILGQLSDESRSKAIVISENFRKLGANSEKLLTLIEKSRPEARELMLELMKIVPANYALYELMAAQFKATKATKYDPVTTMGH